MCICVLRGRLKSRCPSRPKPLGLFHGQHIAGIAPEICQAREHRYATQILNAYSLTDTSQAQRIPVSADRKNDDCATFLSLCPNRAGCSVFMHGTGTVDALVFQFAATKTLTDHPPRSSSCQGFCCWRWLHFAGRLMGAHSMRVPPRRRSKILTRNISA